MKKTKRKVKVVLVASPFFVIFNTSEDTVRKSKKLSSSNGVFLAGQKNQLQLNQNDANNSIAFLVISIIISGGFMLANLINNYYFRNYSAALVPRDSRPLPVYRQKLLLPRAKA